MREIHKVLIRPSASEGLQSTLGLQDYLREHYERVRCVDANIVNRSLPISSIARVTCNDAIVVVLPGVEFKFNANLVDEDILEDIETALDNDIEVYIAYKTRSGGESKWRIYEIDETKLLNDADIAGIAGTTQKILNRAFKTSKFKGGSDIEYSSNKKKKSIVEGMQSVSRVLREDRRVLLML